MLAVKTVYAGFTELVCLFLCEETKRAADFDADFRADTADEMQNFCEVFRISLIPACGNDIEAGSACFFRFLGCFHDFFFRQEGVIVYACVVTADWAQNLQSSWQRPLLALTMAQRSTLLPENF